MKVYRPAPLALFITATLSVLLADLSARAEGAPAAVSFKKDAGRLEIWIGDRTVAAYAYEDPSIPRPYFCNVKTLSGVQDRKSVV